MAKNTQYQWWRPIFIIYLLFELTSGKVPYPDAQIRSACRAMFGDVATFSVEEAKAAIAWMTTMGKLPDTGPAEIQLPGVSAILRSCWAFDCAHRAPIGIVSDWLNSTERSSYRPTSKSRHRRPIAHASSEICTFVV